MPNFPCYDCQKIGDATPRCSDFMSCSAWCEWAREQNILDFDAGDIDDDY